MNLRDTIRSGGTIPLPLSLALYAVTPVQRAGMWWRLRQKRTRVNAQVISIGNITVGGTGKTPAVIERATRELAAGRKVAVLTRGYGSQCVPEPYLANPAKTSLPELAKLIGEEAALIAKRVPGVHLVKSANRVAGAQAAIAEWGCDTIILDDGFQSVALERDENIVLIDAKNPFGNGALLPRGILREPLPQLQRATQIILTRCDQVESLIPHYEIMAKYAPNVPVAESIHAPTELCRVCDGGTLPLDFLKENTVIASCALAHPEAFFATVESLGARIEKRFAFPDHTALPDSTLPYGLPVIVTEKDAVRMANAPDNVYALAVALLFR